MRLAIGFVLAVAAYGQTNMPAPAPAPSPSPEQRALDYLGREVPRWFFENRCYSCHNNGDAARALYVAQRLRYRITPGAFAGTQNWLGTPMRWDRNRGNPVFSDKK